MATKNKSFGAKDSDCLFCKFIKGEITPAAKIFENKHTYAFLDINPCGTLEGHALVLTKKHYETIEEASEEDLYEVMKTIKKLIPIIKKVSGAEGINLIQNNGKAAGQFINHVHFHIIPRKKGDGIYFDEKRRQAKPLELTEVAKIIQRELKER